MSKGQSLASRDGILCIILSLCSNS